MFRQVSVSAAIKGVCYYLGSPVLQLHLWQPTSPPMSDTGTPLNCTSKTGCASREIHIQQSLLTRQSNRGSLFTLDDSCKTNPPCWKTPCTTH
mmetsp:Transcript_108610/g.187870  ORF Transcript_108610/g.187870 Transcript_108610/m.187870 type:complete len:93 (-) Transcript_108610:418-696(-)